MPETQVRSLSQEVPLEEEMATHSSILPGESPWTEEPGGLQSMGLDMTEWLTHAVFLPGKSHGQRSLAGYTMGSQKCRTQLNNDWTTTTIHWNFYFNQHIGKMQCQSSSGTVVCLIPWNSRNSYLDQPKVFYLLLLLFWRCLKICFLKTASYLCESPDSSSEIIGPSLIYLGQVLANFFSK